MAAYTVEQLLAERDRLEDWLKAQPGVVGTGVGLGANGEPALKVFSNGIKNDVRDAILARLGAVPVAIEETGEIRKQ
jgi:hypothetical protein